jgi:ribosomal protein S27E
MVQAGTSLNASIAIPFHPTCRLETVGGVGNGGIAFRPRSSSTAMMLCDKPTETGWPPRAFWHRQNHALPQVEGIRPRCLLRGPDSEEYMGRCLICINPRCRHVIDLESRAEAPVRSRFIPARCPECGHPWSANCPFCGQSLAISKLKTVFRCARCNQVLAPEDRSTN